MCGILYTASIHPDNIPIYKREGGDDIRGLDRPMMKRGWTQVYIYI
jgi:hypothetical protein